LRKSGIRAPHSSDPTANVSRSRRHARSAMSSHCRGVAFTIENKAAWWQKAGADPVDTAVLYGWRRIRYRGGRPEHDQWRCECRAVCSTAIFIQLYGSNPADYHESIRCGNEAILRLASAAVTNARAPALVHRPRDGWIANQPITLMTPPHAVARLHHRQARNWSVRRKPVNECCHVAKPTSIAEKTRGTVGIGWEPCYNESFCGAQEPTKQIDVVATTGSEAACGPFCPRLA
jgi:hypothetical protein